MQIKDRQNTVSISTIGCCLHSDWFFFFFFDISLEAVLLVCVVTIILVNHMFSISLGGQYPICLLDHLMMQILKFKINSRQQDQAYLQFKIEVYIWFNFKILG